MTSAIDPTVPVAGSPTTASVRANFLTAKNEITALQAATAITIPVTVANGGTGATTGPIALSNLGAVPIAGGVNMSGLLVLSGDPTSALGAATKEYVDNYFPVTVGHGGTGAATANGALANLGGAPLASPAFTGTPTAPTVPSSDSSTNIATTSFVHAAITVAIPATPISIANGGTGATTAPAALTSLGALALNGGTMTGALTLNADPTSALQAATKEYVDGLTGAPNKLINPFMEIDQANEGGVTGLNQYIIDGWPLTSINAGALAVSNQRVTDAPPGYPNSIRTTVTTVGTPAANSVLAFQYKLEGDDIIDTLYSTVGARTMSLAFWVKSSITGNYSVGLSNGAGTRSYAVPYTITTANTWQFVTATIPGDTVAGWTLSGNSAQMFVTFGIQLGSTYSGAANVWQAGNLPGVTGGVSNFITTLNASFQLGPCGLWVAPAPQPLLRTSIAAELQRCQRYYEKSYDLGTAVGTNTQAGMLNPQLFLTTGIVSNMNATGTFRVTKRAGPTVTMYSASTGAAGKVRDVVNNVDVNAPLTMSSNSNFITNATSSVAGGNFNLQGHWTADARL